MDSEALTFLQTMIALIVVGILAFAISLIARQIRQPEDAPSASRETVNAPRWPETVLALGLLAVVAAVLFWQFAPQQFDGSVAADAADWRNETKALLFLIVMAAAAVVGGAGTLIVMLANPSKRARGAVPDAVPVQSAATIETPSSTRLLGLLLLALAFLLLGWIYLPAVEQYALMLTLVYPASFAVALVLLVDKATRAWSVKGIAETVREWLFCDAITFLLVLGFFNLRSVATGDSYASLFWDFIHVGLFFLTFWLLDRTASRYRFLLTYGYLVLLALLLLIWQVQQEVPVIEGLSWWSTIWPFFFLAVIFLVLEIIFLLASSSSSSAAAAAAERHGIGAFKDTVFVLLYGMLLIIAIPEAGG